ncbi:MAG: beta-N-acetylglucosaminidase domain-containing protein, partial [Selenomonadaceae bacterium]|nr:beta-N-acetylglucosaminidase domain-containing protein [Selenomonadaceae bacterium]
MKILFACLAAFLLLMGRGEAASAVPLSGVIEGFYGTPWTEAERLDMIAFCGDHGLTAYVYAPKDDPYHREKWREPYPAAELSDLARLVAAADAHHVRFVFAVSPGLDLHLGNGEAADRAAMLAKFEALYALGVRDFAVFFDDIQNRDGAGQAAFLRAVDGELRARHPDVHPLLTVPTEYGYDVMQDGTGAPTDYTRAFAAGLRGSGIIVLYTGDGVARRGLTAERLAAAARLYDGSPL